MARLPTVGGDKGNWGDILNDYLKQSHTDDGTLKPEVVGASQLRQDAVTSAAIADGQVTSSKIASAAVGSDQLMEDSVTVSKISDVGVANGIAALGEDGRVPESQLPERLSPNSLLGLMTGSLTTQHDVPNALGFSPDVVLSPSLTHSRSGVVGHAGVEPKALFAQFSTAQAAPTNRYYASPSGDDSNPGTYASPFRSLKKCIEAANAGNQPCRVLVSSGEYLEGNGFEGISPTVDTAFVAAGGVVTTGRIVSNYSAFAFHSTYSRTAYVNPTPTGGVSRVLDLTRVNEFGNFVELLKVPSEALANETPGSYFEGSALFIHRADGSLPTAQNTRILVTGNNFVLTSQVNVYVGTEDNSVWQVQGAPNSFAGADPGAMIVYLSNPSIARKAFVCENVQADYAGEATAGVNGITIHKWNGIAAFFNCTASAAAKDGFNAHNAGGTLAQNTSVLTVNCGADDLGRLNQSANGLTLHEAVVGIDIAGRYRRGRGGTIHNINNSRHWLLGTSVEGDLGDRLAGGGIQPVAILANNSAQIWAEQVSVDMPRGRFAYGAFASTARIRKRNCLPVAQPDFGPAASFESY
jgi:hypothetical protein